MNIINTFKSIMDSKVKIQTRAIQSVPLLMEGQLNGKRLEVVLDPDLVLGSGGRFAVVSVESNRYVISVDNDFKELSENCRKFLLLHEIGHVMHEHYKNPLHIILRILYTAIFNKVDKRELEADAYAIEHMPKEDIEKAFRELLLVHPLKEIKLRYNYIKSL